MSSSAFDGYVARPAGGRGLPVLVLHAWWGLNDTIKLMCDHLAQVGYTALAPDLYGGRVVDTIHEADEIASRLDAAAVRTQLDRTLELMRRDSSGGPVAVIGFSLGAWFAMELSESHPQDVDRVVVFYGTGPREYSQSRAAYLGHFADPDEYEPREGVEELHESLLKAGRDVTFHFYEGVGHWFFEPDRPTYDEAAADLAWERTLSFLTPPGR